MPWQAERSIVVWRGERAAKSLAKWAAVVARATKQSRRARMPLTSSAVDLPALVARVQAAALTVVLHEEATEPLAGVGLPAEGDVLVVVGPEGGISPRELDALWPRVGDRCGSARPSCARRRPAPPRSR